MASPPDTSFLKVPAVRSILSAPAVSPASFWILLISACETVLSTVTTTCLVLASTAHAVPATSAERTASRVCVSSAALNVFAVSDALAEGIAKAATARRPEPTAISRVDLALPLRGYCA